MAKKSGLGKGFGIHALIPDAPAPEGETSFLKTDQIEPNREQPRKSFDREKLEALAASIRENGMVQPIIVTKEKDYFRIVAGERRWRAAKLLGLEEVPVIVRSYTGLEADQIALVENLQRDDLNPMEEAGGYRKLMDKYGMTQEEVSRKIGKSRPAVANALRLLSLPEDIQKLLEENKLSAGHARALLALPSAKKMSQMGLDAVKSGCSVRELERLVKKETEEKKPAKKPAPVNRDIAAAVEMSCRKLEKRLGSKVNIRYSGSFKGKLELPFANYEQMVRLLENLEQ